MTDRSSKTNSRNRPGVAMCAVGLVLLANPAAAQSFGSPVNPCVPDARSSVKIGTFDSVAAAVESAKGADVKSGAYAIATVEQHRIAIDAGGVAHEIMDGFCSGSGPGLQKPE